MNKRILYLFKKNLFPMLLLAMYSSVLFSQNTARFNRITSEQGLSQGAVNCILEDNEGFMWFGTQDGLNKYNGYGTIVYKHNPVDSNSLSNNFIYSLYEDKNNVLWIGTNGSGLDAFDLYTNKFTHYQNTADAASISNNDVWSIIEGKDGLLWIGTDDGLNSFDRKTHRFQRYFNNGIDSLNTPENMIYSLHQDENGIIWMGTYGAGLFSFNPKTKKFTHYASYGKNPTNTNFLSDKIKSIYEDKKDNLWIATDGGGLGNFNIKTKTFGTFLLKNPTDSNSISANYTTSVVQDSSGKFWIGSFYGGVTCYDTKNNLFTHFQHDNQNPKSLVNNDVKCLYLDRQGILWIGTQNGVSLRFRENDQFALYKNSSQKQGSNCVMGLLEDKDGLLWIATNGAGVFTLDRKTQVFTSYANLTNKVQNNAALALYQDRDGLIWVGTWGNGLVSYNKETQITERYNESNSQLKGSAETVTCITQNDEGLIWFGTYGAGLFSLNKKTNKIVNYNVNNGLSSNNIYTVYIDKNKNLWIGTDGGGVMIRNNKTGKIITIKKDKEGKNSLSANTVYSIYQDNAGIFWLGTNIGLDKYDLATKQFTDYFEKDGLPNDVIYSILPDENGNLWLSTNKGISKFNPNIQNVDGTAFRNYDVNDGLQGKEFNQGAYFENNKSGELFFGGVNGINSFFPSKIKGNEHIPPVYITSYKLFGKDAVLDTTISSKKYIQLSWKDNFFSFDFVALDYQMSFQNKYQYKLDGVDEDWSPPSTRRFASYTQLGGGDYVLHVRACNNDGVWNNKGAVLYIRIIPPFWRTKWFYALCILIIILSIFGFIRYRTQSIQKEKKILEDKVEERTKELAQKNKDITSSIQYAKRIQEAILPPQKQIFARFKDAFIVYKPKDIVSGDFYWFAEKGGKAIVATVDCTGHGVPGAFMSMIGHNLLNQIVNEKGIITPSEILDEMHHGVQRALKQGEHNIDTNDGMDIALCAIDLEKNELEFAGAYRPLFIINGNDFEKIEPTKFPIGGTQIEFKPFVNHTKKIKKGDTIYIFSDGYADQFGGKDGKKFMVKRFQELLISSQKLSMKEQGNMLDKNIEEWKGDFQQVDDILVIGIRF